MPYETFMQLKDKNGANIFHMKGWRWEGVIDREVKQYPTKSLPGATTVNPPLALDFGSNTRSYALMGRLNTNRQVNVLQDQVIEKWFTYLPVTLVIGDAGADQISVTGLVDHMHADWQERLQYWTIAIHFLHTGVFPI